MTSFIVVYSSQTLPSQVAIIPNCSILAAVGQKMASTPGVSATLFNALAKVIDLSTVYMISLTTVYES